MSAKSKRILPSWMVQNVTRDSKDEQCEVSGKENLPKSSLSKTFDEKAAYLEFKGQIHYIYIRDECNFVCQDIIESLQQSITCGFDIEWRTTYKAGESPRETAVIQLCMSENECFIFHISAMMTGFPVALKNFIEDKRIIKTGIGIVGDMSKLSVEFNLHPSGVVDLSSMLNEVKKIKENWSLSGMVIHMFNKRLRKDLKIRCSNWEKYPLTDEQLRYAALDAYASWKLHSKIMMLKQPALE